MTHITVVGTEVVFLELLLEILALSFSRPFITQDSGNILELDFTVKFDEKDDNQTLKHSQSEQFSNVLIADISDGKPNRLKSSFQRPYQNSRHLQSLIHKAINSPPAFSHQKFINNIAGSNKGMMINPKT